MKKKLSKKIAKGAVSVLDTFLHVDANSAAQRTITCQMM